MQRAEGETLQPVGHLGEDGRDDTLGKVRDRGQASLVQGHCSRLHHCARAESHFNFSLRREEKRFRSYQVMVLASVPGSNVQPFSVILHESAETDGQRTCHCSSFSSQ